MLNSKRLNIIEGIGLLLILFSFLVQLIETDIESEVREAEFYQIQVKLDRLWTLESKDYIEKHPELNVFFNVNFEGINNDWKYYSEDKEYLDKWKQDVLYKDISNMRILIFVIGSVLVLIPKFNRKKPISNHNKHSSCKHASNITSTSYIIKYQYK